MLSKNGKGESWILFFDSLAILSIILLIFSLFLIVTQEMNKFILIFLVIDSLSISIFTFFMFYKSIKIGKPQYWIPIFFGSIILIGPIFAIIFYKIYLRNEIYKNGVFSSKNR